MAGIDLGKGIAAGIVGETPETAMAQHRLPGISVFTRINPMVQAVEISGEFHLILSHHRSVAREATAEQGQRVLMQIVHDVEDEILRALRHRIAEDRAEDQRLIESLTRERDEARAMRDTLQAAVDRLAR